MTSEIVHRNGDALSGVASLFFETVKEEQDAPGEDYPYVHVVELDGRTFIGFESDLPRTREPWSVRGLDFGRDTVFEADGKSSLDLVSGDMKTAVNALVGALA